MYIDLLEKTTLEQGLKNYFLICNSFAQISKTMSHPATIADCKAVRAAMKDNHLDLISLPEEQAELPADIELSAVEIITNFVAENSDDLTLNVLALHALEKMQELSDNLSSIKGLTENSTNAVSIIWHVTIPERKGPWFRRI